MKISAFVSAFAVSAVLMGGVALAVEAAPAAKPMAAPAASPMAASKGVETPASAECYKQADAKGLHGKPRKKFHRECMKGK
jgi:hypothetical protein